MLEKFEPGEIYAYVSSPDCVLPSGLVLVLQVIGPVSHDGCNNAYEESVRYVMGVLPTGRVGKFAMSLWRRRKL